MKQSKNQIGNKVKNIVSLVFVMFTICACTDLDIEDENNFDAQDVLNSSTLIKFGEESFVNLWQASHKASVNITALVAADQFTASWGNYGWQQVSNEPRLQWNNSVTGDIENDKVSVNFWYDTYSALSQANLTIKRLNEGVDIGSDSLVYMLKALCYHVQGVGLGQLGLVYDQAIITNENTPINNVEMSKYYVVVDSAIASLEKSIAICKSRKFILKSDVINGITVNQDYLIRLSYSYIVRFMVQKARNKAENDKTDWQKVIDYSNKGILNDFAPLEDGELVNSGKWYNFGMYQLNKLTFARVDCRIINLLDAQYPTQYPANGIAPLVHFGGQAGEAFSNDKRLQTDFEYLPSVNFFPERGYYHFSNYRYKRFDSVYSAQRNRVHFVEFRKYELDMYKAEAYLKNNQLNIALSLLNSSNRITRGRLGSLPPTAKVDDVLNAIFYEREIELLAQGFFVGFCDMRRRDLLQKGTPLHFPVPAKELQTQNKAVYTFGGIENADGVNTSNGGWK